METKELPKYKISDNTLLQIATKIVPGFNYDAKTKELYTIVAEYINQDSAFEKRFLPTNKGNINFSLKKGLFIISNPGSGKSFLFEDILKQFLKYRQITAYEIQERYLDSGVLSMKIWEESVYRGFG